MFEELSKVVRQGVTTVLFLSDPIQPLLKFRKGLEAERVLLLINRASLVDHPSVPLVISARLDNNWLLIEYLSARSLIKSIPLL